MRRLTGLGEPEHLDKGAGAYRPVPAVTRQRSAFILGCLQYWNVAFGEVCASHLAQIARKEDKIMKSKTRLMMGLWLTLTLVISACSLKFESNPDGSTRMEITLDEAAMQTRIQQSIRDPQVREFHVELRDGFIEVSGTRQNAQTGNLDSMSYRLDLGAEDGHLTAVISNVVINDFPLQPDWLEPWNERIAENLAASGQNNPNSSFQSVTITEDNVTMVWRIEPIENQ